MLRTLPTKESLFVEVAVCVEIESKCPQRTVAGVLAGRITTEESVKRNKPFAEQFAQMLDNGCTIAEVRVEKTERDDDWIEFLFSDRDPSISPFKLAP
jgi:hypothetical protein